MRNLQHSRRALAFCFSLLVTHASCNATVAYPPCHPAFTKSIEVKLDANDLVAIDAIVKVTQDKDAKGDSLLDAVNVSITNRGDYTYHQSDYRKVEYPATGTIRRSLDWLQGGSTRYAHVSLVAEIEMSSVYDVVVKVNDPHFAIKGAEVDLSISRAAAKRAGDLPVMTLDGPGLGSVFDRIPSINADTNYIGSFSLPEQTDGKNEQVKVREVGIDLAEGDVVYAQSDTANLSWKNTTAFQFVAPSTGRYVLRIEPKEEWSKDFTLRVSRGADSKLKQDHPAVVPLPPPARHPELKINACYVDQVRDFPPQGLRGIFRAEVNANDKLFFEVSSFVGGTVKVKPVELKPMLVANLRRGSTNAAEVSSGPQGSSVSSLLSSDTSGEHLWEVSRTRFPGFSREAPEHNSVTMCLSRLEFSPEMRFSSLELQKHEKQNPVCYK